MADTPDTKNLATKFKIPVPGQLDFKVPILVIDDQTDLRLIVVHQLQKLGFSTVKQCTSAIEAIELLKNGKTKFGVIICDMELEEMSGLELLAELRENTDLTRVPFCLTMASVSKEKLMLAVENGVDEILVKPYTLGDIGTKIRGAFKVFHNPSNPEKVYELAKTFLRNKKLKESKMVYGELANAAPTAARPLVGLGRIELEENKLDAAMDLFNQAEEKNPNFVHLYVEKANVHTAQNDWPAAIESFKKAIELSPLNAYRYKSAIDVLFKVKCFKDAAELLEQAIAKGVKFGDLYHYASQAQFSLKDYEKAQKYIRQALQLNPTNATYMNQLGICLKELKQFPEAEKIYNKIIKSDPNNLAATYNKAVLLHAKGNGGDAIRLLEKLSAKHPEFRQAQTKLDEYNAEDPSKSIKKELKKS